MARGAALPKLARYVKAGRPQVRLECESCGVHGPLVVSATPARAKGLCAEGVALACPDCGGRIVPSAVGDCETLAPHLLTRHPVYIEDAAAEGERQLREVARDYRAGPDDCCTYCGHERAPQLDPDEWYCRKCRHVNETRPDGSRGVFAATPFSPEVERCNGLARKVRKPRQIAKAEGERERPVAVNDSMPF